eukprot:CAMPEP_0168758690 /NCGR_PEP_ID=MMETSP0724-20121128/21833_1 /TAXON_ID=265536 /ORGANISM="Amphiprora sp., Strain CCMP467" /LENGTH=49 /DNA_ID= /DNA_START= /DNA_END= /DNA_ORIENTATION=
MTNPAQQKFFLPHGLFFRQVSKQHYKEFLAPSGAGRVGRLRALETVSGT